MQTEYTRKQLRAEYNSLKNQLDTKFKEVFGRYGRDRVKFRAGNEVGEGTFSLIIKGNSSEPDMVYTAVIHGGTIYTHRVLLNAYPVNAEELVSRLSERYKSAARILSTESEMIKRYILVSQYLRG